jgi:hypothetical protein
MPNDCDHISRLQMLWSALNQAREHLAALDAEDDAHFTNGFDTDLESIQMVELNYLITHIEKRLQAANAIHESYEKQTHQIPHYRFT